MFYLIKGGCDLYSAPPPHTAGEAGNLTASHHHLHGIISFHSDRLLPHQL